ncbi:unnamed protein product [Ectocarpus sp. 13 AM-2016]
MATTSSMLWYLCPHPHVPYVSVPPGVDHITSFPAFYRCSFRSLSCFSDQNRSVVTPQDSENLSR